MTALYIILGIIAFFIILLSIRVTVVMDYHDSFLLEVKWLFLKYTIYPNDREKKPKKEKKKKEKPVKEQPAAAAPKEPAAKKDNIIVAFYKNQGFDATLQLLRDTVKAINGMFGSIFSHFIFRELYLFITAGSADAAQTAVNYGKLCAEVFPAMGLICSKAKVKKYDVGVMPNFFSPTKSAVFRAIISIRPIFMINAAVVLGIKLLFKVVIKLLRNKTQMKKEAENSPPIKEETTV